MLCNNNITSIALKSSGARAQKRNKTKSLNIFKSRGHTYRGHHQFNGPPTILKSNFEEISFEVLRKEARLS